MTDVESGFVHYRLCFGPCRQYKPAEQFTHTDSAPWGLPDWCDACWTAQRSEAWKIYRMARRLRALVPSDSCQECGKVCAPTGHHTNYLRPLEIVWCCSSCHSRLHRQARLDASHATE